MVFCILLYPCSISHDNIFDHYLLHTPLLFSQRNEPSFRRGLVSRLLKMETMAETIYNNSTPITNNYDENVTSPSRQPPAKDKPFSSSKSGTCANSHAVDSTVSTSRDDATDRSSRDGLETENSFREDVPSHNRNASNANINHFDGVRSRLISTTGDSLPQESKRCLRYASDLEPASTASKQCSLHSTIKLNTRSFDALGDVTAEAMAAATAIADAKLKAFQQELNQTISSREDCAIADDSDAGLGQQQNCISDLESGHGAGAGAGRGALLNSHMSFYTPRHRQEQSAKLVQLKQFKATQDLYAIEKKKKHELKNSICGFCFVVFIGVMVWFLLFS